MKRIKRIVMIGGGRNYGKTKSLLAEREKIRKKVEAAVRLTEIQRSLHERIRRMENE